ncbi:MAG: ATP-binding protein [Myxococcota bacterium]
MSRIRIALLILLVGILLPTALIVRRAVESIAVENEVQHTAVADRIFDEMERSLSDFLLREESRPPSDYAAPSNSSSASNGGLGSARMGGEAFENADEAFILGWFALDGSGLTRLHPAPQAEASAATTQRLASAIREGLAARGASSLATSPETSAPTPSTSASPRPESLGKTEARSSSEEERKDRREADFAQQKERPEEQSTYEILQSLNRAQVLRSERQSKSLKKIAPQKAGRAREAYPEDTATSATPSAAPSRLPSHAPSHAPSFDDALADTESTFAGTSDPRPGSADGFVEQGEEPEERDDSAAQIAAFQDPTSEIVLDRDAQKETVSVDPLTSRATSSNDLLLIRSVWSGDKVERQGLVIDRLALAHWLEDNVLGESALADLATLHFGETRGGRTAAAHSYRHDFAEPFEALTARLELQPLPGIGSPGPVYAIAGLLVAVTLLGLFAVDRMTGVVVDYAQRRADFVAAVSHELKTPLTSIRMYSEMLRDGLVPTEEKRADYYATITDESERLSRLIDNVLEFSRLEQNRRDPVLIVGSVAEAIQEAALKLDAHVERQGFSLSLDLDETSPAVQYDRDAVTQLLFNLVDNALKYAKGAEDKTIQVRLQQAADGASTLSVRDFGPGVPPDQLNRVFEPFYRVGEELTRTTAGTGIGLALVKELAEGMGAVTTGRNATGGGFEVRIAFAPASA